VVGADRDHRLTGMDAGVLAGPHRPQQSQFVGWPLKLAVWVSDFTYVMTWSGVVYVAFVIDAFSRRIVGWKADTSMRTQLVLDTL
jgi:transposase InsO family protein